MLNRKVQTLLTTAILLPLSLRAVAEEGKKPEASDPKTRLLLVSKALCLDPQDLQERGVVAAKKITDAMRKFRPESIVDALAEAVMTKQQFLRGGVKEKVTGDTFRERLRQLAKTVSPQDTVIVYTHTHGRKAGFEELQPLGGMVLDHPIRRPEHQGTILWNEYVELLLKIPAKNVLVLTMSCFSGGLVEHLDSPQVRDRWKDRKPKQGRNLIFLTSQNKDRMSPPIVKDGEVINPFTFAVAKALAGEADGFKGKNGESAESRRKDGKLTVGEIIDYILHTTENTISEHAQRWNIAKPQVTGSFDREDVLILGTGPSAQDDGGESRDSPSDPGAERFKRLFKALDKNGDGILTPGELGNPPLFASLDTNGDGKLFLDEALKALTASRKK
ncbi:MAG: EF-hand domain-containing protein [Planctomycetota bacterium]|jgi:hypothetical protein